VGWAAGAELSGEGVTPSRSAAEPRSGLPPRGEGGKAAARAPNHRVRLVNRKPGRGVAFALAAIPFVLVILAYAVGSYVRLSENPADKLLPALSTMAESFYTMAFTPEFRTGDHLLWVDTAASLTRLAVGVGISALLALTLGIAIGFIPLIRAGLAPFVSALSLIPPLAVLPILFIVFGLGELAKVALIVIGIAPVMVRSMSQSVAALPTELIVKAQTLGASTWQMVTRVVLPQMLPQLVSTTRLALGPAWIFLISAEAIASTSGLGYRIFLVRRYLSMDIILPYVLWITLIAFAIDFALRLLAKRAFRWAYGDGQLI
jgi:NitT/TauT family transport system permease protein